MDETAAGRAAMELSNKNVLITGANRGIGRAFLDEVLARGVSRVYAAVRDPGSLTDVVAEHGHRVVAVPFDLADRSSVVDLAGRCSDVDLVIANAALGLRGPVLDVAEDDVRAVFEANVFAPLHLLRALSPGLVERRGAAVLISSVSALLLSRSSPLYSASKAALTMAVMGLRAQLSPLGVRIGIVYPGFVDTDMTAGMMVPKASAQSVARRSLDDVAAGSDVVLPDRYAEIVLEELQRDLRAALTDPKRTADVAVSRLVADPG